MMKQGRDISALDFVIEKLAASFTLDEGYRDHSLKGGYAGYRECHIEPDWLLIYGYETLADGERQLLCVRTGDHAELFAL
jgi:mRNA interferase YafQ